VCAVCRFSPGAHAQGLRFVDRCHSPAPLQ
jgi:hypothetical protein